MSLADAARTPHTSTADALLTVRGLHKRFGDNEVLRGIDPVSYTHLTLPTKA